MDPTPPAAPPAPPLPAPAEMSPADCAQQLKQRFPALFDGPLKPMKLRIQAFFRRHTGGTGYLLAMTKSPHRYDLDGQPAGEVSEEHRRAASEELARRRANHQAKLDQAEEGRRNRAGLLRDFERTTLTPANFCALKGIAPQALDALLATARREAEERARQRPPHGAPPQRERRGPPGAPPARKRDAPPR